MTPYFRYGPTPLVLHWLSAGQLANRLLRSIRLWVLLQRLYGAETHWVMQLPQPFRYRDLRDRLYGPSHPTDESVQPDHFVTTCANTECLCQVSAQTCLHHLGEIHSVEEWMEGIAHLTGLDHAEIAQRLAQNPFATVHRSIRDDLKLLSDLGWLTALPRGYYHCRHPEQWPSLPIEQNHDAPLPLSSSQIWELLRLLESVAFAQPSLNVVINTLWEHLTARGNRPLGEQEPMQRIFLHLDYILSEEDQDRVDGYQDQIERLWRTASDGVVQFDYLLAQHQRIVQATVYPVCLQYIRRAKYLSAYGRDPNGCVTWHNYRLDRIISNRLRVLPWGDSQVPSELKQQWQTGQLPTPQQVHAQLDQAWGFNFYLPKAFMIMRFPPRFAHYYVDDTVRHSTFEAIAYDDLPDVIQTHVPDIHEQTTILEILKRRSPNDAYYRAWIRPDDTNVMMRLRDWRPLGEVIAPLSVRHRMQTEAETELRHYMTE